jgi:hypothetical protein
MAIGTEEIDMPEDEATLADALESLRDGLEEAWEKGQGSKVRFEVSEVTLTIETEIHKDTDASAGVRWYVLHAGASKKTGTGTTQTLVLTLTPALYDEKGNRMPLNVHGRSQPHPAN